MSAVRLAGGREPRLLAQVIRLRLILKCW